MHRPGGGYIFSTGNCVYTGMDLGRYELMLDVWRAEGGYEQGHRADGQANHQCPGRIERNDVKQRR